MPGESSAGTRRRRLVVASGVLVLILLGIWARTVYFPRFGTNFDLQSWALVAEIVENGGNVYAETDRYNYGPVWSWVLHGFGSTALYFQHPGRAFILFLALLLTLADLGIMAVLYRRFGAPAALLFFLHPVSMMVSGYKFQFDNLAIFIGLVALEAMDRRTENGWWWWVGLGLLGVSIATKHVLFAFPLWIAVKEEGWTRKISAVVIPVAIFFVSFVPYWTEGHAGILRNVFGYSPGRLQPFWEGLVPPLIGAVMPSSVWFFGSMVLFALVFRRYPRHGSLLFYILVLFVFSPEMANQYLAIPLAAVAVYMNFPFALYSLAATAHFLKQMPNSPYPGLLSWIPAPLVDYPVCTALALAGLVWIFFASRIKRGSARLIRWAACETRIQMRGGGAAESQDLSQ